MAKKAIKSVNLLPEFLRTDKNSKFLSSTIDQLIQPPQLERIDGYVGSKVTPTYDPNSDFYISESLPLRAQYQLEPAMVVSDIDNNVQDVIAIDDLINEIGTKGGINTKFDRLFDSEIYSFNPHIDWDKLVNYQEYFWLVSGPDTITITGQQKNTTSTYVIRDNELGSSFIFNPNGLVEDPLITLYRGNTYHFEVDSKYKFFIKTAPSLENTDLLNQGITNNGVSNGTITLLVNNNTPDILYYSTSDQPYAAGRFLIKDITQDSAIDVENEILGKKNYISNAGIKLSNGMKVRFGGDVYPADYRNKEFFVEGVGVSIVLIDSTKLTSSENMSNVYDDNFDAASFDTYPFDSFKNLPITPEYITINRASRDLNPWTRYNRWIHRDIITASAAANNQVPVYPSDKRAKRPIIEFKPNLKLFNFGTIGINNVDLVDNDTIDAFSTVQGSAGYYVDGVLLEQGHRVIFNADTDSSVRGKIFEVYYHILDNNLRLELKSIKDPATMSSISVNLGDTYQGTSWWFDGDVWQLSQQHTKLNQAPLFDLFDNAGRSYSDRSYYLSDFTGNKIFSYDIGTGLNDTVLGFPLKYRNSVGVGSYLFKNHFMTEYISITENQQVMSVPTSETYCKFSDYAGDKFKNVWVLVENYRVPIIQFSSFVTETSSLVLNAIDNPKSVDFLLEIYVEEEKLTASEYSIDTTTSEYIINFVNKVPANANIVLKIYTDVAPNKNGYYETPVSQTNNPLNGNIASLTLSELSDHLHTMVHKSPDFSGLFPGLGNLRDLPGIEKYGTRLISNATSMAFPSMFIGKKEHSVVDAITKAADQYNQFKIAFLQKMSEIGDGVDTVSSVDIILKELNKDKDVLSPHYLSDMIAYGTDKTVRTWTVTDARNVVYPITTDFDPTALSLRSVLVYLNGTQLLIGRDYLFEVNDSSVRLLTSLSRGDVIEVCDYYSTVGSFVPVTPSKLGLYPKYLPMKYSDTTYINGPVNVIQGHDGSITVAYNDFRDDIILELEKRIFNNIKQEYRPELFDIDSVIPGAFRKTEYTISEVNSILERDFIKWAGFHGIEYDTNNYFDIQNPKTWNFTGSYNPVLDKHVPGHWRNVYSFYYDTDRPNTTPWEMLGIAIQPDWWEDTYGPAPYTSENEILWGDLEAGYIRGGPTPGKNPKYARPGLSLIIPVDDAGELLDPTVRLVENNTPYNIRQGWKFGDQGPAETAWRRSSYWPFALQRALALAKPAKYTAFMYDLSRTNKNIAGQWAYGSNNKFLDLKSVYVHDDANTLTSGYSVFVSEAGQQRSATYINELKQDLLYINFNLFYKVGGFVSKDKLQITIDSIDPTSVGQGVLLPTENYKLILNVSNPIKSAAISGIVIQKSNGKFVLKGYDRFNPYFNVLTPMRSKTTPAITVGGVSEPYLVWTSSGTAGQTGLSAADLTTANSASVGKLYQEGQIVLYGNVYYRVKTTHRAEAAFNPSYYQSLPSLPIKGGVAVQSAQKFNKEVTQIPYGSEFTKVQEVYDIILGYGEWLTTQGFIFDEYNSDLGSTLDWSFTGKEFLYWTTQNWAENSVITLSPFADKIKYSLPTSVVDNVFDSFYEYSILQANGTPLPQRNINVTRNDGVCTIETLIDTDGMYFAIVNSVQKEHAMVFDNTTKFNDTIYSIESGYRQKRMKLSGFRTAGWNGDYFSPGFVYDNAHISDWKEYVTYKHGDVVRYKGKYYSAKVNVVGASSFDFADWTVLSDKPVAGLLPNFDYKINQFEDFYSLDIDNFDTGQQRMAQHLTGYTPRVYLNNIFTNPIAQYKFYQGFIKEKGTRNSVSKLAKASTYNLQGELTFTEEWAFRVGQYGSFQTYQEIEVPLSEGKFIENPQVINFVDTKPNNPNDLIFYTTSSDRIIVPDDYIASATFDTNPATLLVNDFVLTNAGYVRLDDVTSTAYNDSSLLDIANNRNLNEGDIVWLGFKSNGDWDILRYTRSAARVVGVFVSSPVSEITFVTDVHHEISAGDIISVTQFNDQVNGVYIVSSTPNLTQFTVSSTLAAIENAVLSSPGLLFSFVSHRFSTFDTMPSDQELVKFPEGTKLWIDNAGDDKWAVYEKVKNYVSYSTTSTLPIPDQRLGWAIQKPKGSDVFVVGSPGFLQYGKYGRVSLFNKVDDSNTAIFRYTFNENINYSNPTSPTEFGHSVVYDDTIFADTQYGLIFAGAPAASNVKSNSTPGGLRYSTGTETASSYTQEGAVKISCADVILNESVDKFVLLSPIPTPYQRFGSSLFVQRNKNEKLLLVGAPGTATTGSGVVYAYTVGTSPTTSTISVALLGSFVLSPETGSLFGYSNSGSDDGKTLAISAPGADQVHVSYTGSSSSAGTFTVINSPFGQNARFGEVVKVSPLGDYLFVSAPFARSADQSYGRVAVYKKNNGVFELDSTLSNPVPNIGMKFGMALDVNTGVDTLTVTALGTNKSLKTTFDKTSNIVDQTTFDSKITDFYGSITSSGTAYVYSRKHDRFVLSEEFAPRTTIEGTNYGHSVAVDDTVIFVGAPAYNTDSYSAFYQFNKIDASVNGWVPLRSQDTTVNIENIQKITLIDTFNEEVLEYLDIVDPLKGKISGLAEQELKYKSAFDPAVYSLGIAGTVNDTNSNWLDDHVGELWWDLSTVKYTWYEQGDLTYRKNNWGKLFPGATIDVYEWVGSPYLPSEWSSLADTSAGLTEGISGQPKFSDNSVISVKQIYNATSNSFTNYYYYWVKNKVTVPDVRNRRISSYQVASVIADPTAYGLTYASILDSDAVALSNVGPLLVDNRIHLNIAVDTINNDIPRHTEWLLLQEGAENSVPNSLLEKKLFDSLLGRDSLGNLVPDPSLSSRVKYGIGIRPQQTLFKDRFSALRNLIEFSNSILIKNRITGNHSFKNLNKMESIPDEYSHEYDQVVEDTESLDSSVIDTSQLETTILRCTVSNGKLRSIIIDNPGFGYKISPTVNIVSDSGVGAVLSTIIDEFGRVTAVNIDAAGDGYITAPTLEVRPYTVIVLADTTFNNKWTKFVFKIETGQWIRIHTQKYNTSLYWKYVDWKSDTYNPFLDYQSTVDDVYEVQSLDLAAGQYVKVKNGGLGWYIILEKKANGVKGTFDEDFDIVYSENGTIQFLNTLWDVSNNNFGFDQTSSFDQTLYDQFPDIELQYILSALKSDLFINELKVNWNLFFFKAVKYALSEQKLLDWAFKTSFINVRNQAGTLDQRPVYKLTSSTYYEEYLKEVKPYHTNIRSFTTDYSVVEPSQTYTTDFDLPAVYDKTLSMFTAIETGDSRLGIYPWKSWTDNYSFEVGSIVVGNPGANYTLPPEVVITPAEGDTGSGATAKAYIRSGEVVQVEVTNPGSGYKKAPIVKIVGGGSSTLTKAIVYAQLFNGKVRSNTIGMKFDRISSTGQSNNADITDSFTADGSVNTFELSWLASADKSKITVAVDKVKLLGADYTIDYYTSIVNGYNKKFNKLVLLDYVPKSGQVITITYQKNVDLLSATDRILTYYTATSGMPGAELDQLMTGIEYPRTRIEGLPFDYTSKWDASQTPFGGPVWADDVSNYNMTNIVSTATTGSNFLFLSTTTSVAVGQFINIIGTLTNKFATTSDIKITEVDDETNMVTFDSTLVLNVYPGEVLETWNQNSNASTLDSAINGGTWSETTSNYLVGALGINPADLTIDGSSFYTPDSGFAPEELVAGNATDSVGINVYTKNYVGAPTVFVNNFDIYAGSTSTRTLSITPPGENFITVVFNHTILNYNTTTNFTSADEFTINWDTNEIIVPPQTVNGKLGYTIIQIGGGTGSDPGVVDSSFVTTIESEAQVQSLASYNSIQSAYVTVNGESISAVTTSTDYGYMLTYANLDNRRAAVNVYNLPEGQNTVQAWFFGSGYGYFNEVREEEFLIVVEPTYTFTLTKPPGNIEPYSSQAIVEIWEPTRGRRRLTPPFVSYYELVDSNRTFNINNNKTRLNGSYSIGQQNAKVYLNGIKLRPGFDYSVNANNTVNLTGVGNMGDVVAIVDLYNEDYEYVIEGNVLQIVPRLNAGYTVKVITYTDHDKMLIRTERFDGSPTNRFKISRPVVNDNYVWVSINGIPLTSKLDYEMLDDNRTVEISEDYRIVSSDDVVIMSVSSQELATTVLGYRIFNDIFNRTHFKRLSKYNTTFLTEPLSFTDTEIYVSDATLLSPPIPSKKIPGVILVDGERIEFFKVQRNTLSQLRRATLGTSPSFYSEKLTKVIDQSRAQTIPFEEDVLIQKQITQAGTNVYTINTSTDISTHGDGITLATSAFITLITGDIDTAKANSYAQTALKMAVGIISTSTAYDLDGDGRITSSDALGYLKIAQGKPVGFTPSLTSNYRELFLTTSVSSNPINAVDQVLVYYGGRLLRKAGMYHQDISLAYDHQEADIIGTTSTSVLLPTTMIENTAYLVTDTNQVWVYTDSKETSAINGYVYKGLNYLPPEFTINTSTQAITLNIDGGIVEGLELVIVKKEFARSTVWNDEVSINETLSILESTTEQAKFLQAQPSELPDIYYYGGDPELVSDSGFALTDINGEPLEGF